MNSHGLSCVCGACVPPGAAPPPPDNRPSLPTVAYRRGSFATFRRMLLDRLTLDPTLARLSTRQPDDHIVATVELWAVVAEVLDFHTERYANEAFLGTAREPRSVQLLARLVGYRPRPGVAALGWLVFTLDPGTQVALPQGVRVQSVPGPSTGGPPPPPATFETLQPLAADATWNNLRAFHSANPAAPALSAGQRRTVLRRDIAPELAEGLHPNDTVVLWKTTRVEEKTVSRVVNEGDRMVVEWATPVRTGGSTSARRFTRVLRVFGASAPTHWMQPSNDPDAPGGIAWTFSTTAFTVSLGATTLDLEGKVDDLDVGSRLLVVPASGQPRLVTVTSLASANASVGPLTDSVTRVGVSPSLPAYNRRSVRIYSLAGPEIDFWGGDYPRQVPGTVYQAPAWYAVLPDGRVGVEVGRRIEGGAWVPGDVLDLEDIEAGRVILVAWSGEAGPTTPAPLVARLTERPELPVFDDIGFGHLRFVVSLDEPPGPDWPAGRDVMLLGNVVRASHGETTTEVVGNGDATRPFPRLALKRKPVTYLPAPVPGGIVSTLAVGVDGVIRPEVPALYGQPADAAVVATTTRPDGTTVVLGGDGKRMGARFTTGVGNVRARYRVGSGLAGRVAAEALTTLLDRPTGVRGVRNPLAAEGGADPESLERSRRNAPASVRTLGRVVSLRDAEDLLLSTGLVAKAQAVWVWDGLDRLIHLTVAAPGGDPLSDELRQTLAKSLDAARDRSHHLRVDDRVLVPITLVANVVVTRLAERPDLVLAAADNAARAALGFDTVALGRALAVSDLIAVVAAVDGVVGVDVDRFAYAPAAGFTEAELDSRGVTRLPDGTVAPVQARLRMYPARAGAARGTVLPAELPSVQAPSDIRINDGGRA